jgi:SpoVK/Ycf46/Vps4 family AAA+-type ATPase
VIFLDEIDSLLCARSESEPESSRKIKTQFMIELEGLNTSGAQIVTIGATNRPDDIDEAVRRRLEKRLYIPLPNAAGRAQFLHRIMKNDAMENQIDMTEDEIKKLITLTLGYSGADLKSLCTDAALMPTREIDDILKFDIKNIRTVKMNDFEKALKNVPATVNPDALEKYMDWNKKYGSI